MVTVQQYFGKPHSSAQENDADDLLVRVNELLADAQAAGSYDGWLDPDTDSQISGAKGSDGDGGFRTPASRTGVPSSAHRQAKAVDVYDPHEILEQWITDAVLEKYELYREAPEATPGWVHLTTRAPASGHRTFIP